jgi:hypothetical protein
MIKSYTKLSAIASAIALLISGFSLAQPGTPETPIGTSTVTQSSANQKSLDSCGYETNHYLLTKMTVSEYYYMNIGDGATTINGAFPRRAQYYPGAGQDIMISGISFYAFIFGQATTTPVVTSIYSANADSTLSTLLASDTIDVTGNTFDAYLPNMQFSSLFDNPVTLNSAYIVTVETMSNDSLALISNSFANSEGAGENLALSYYAYPSAPGNDGWFKHSAYTGWDADFIIMPIIKTEVSNDEPFLVSEDTVCLGESIITDYTSQSPIFWNRFYSINSANSLENMGLHFGSDSLGPASGVHTYPIAGNFDMVFVDTFELYGYFNAPTQCLITDSFEVVVLDTVITGDFVFTTDFLGGDNIFNPATASDSNSFQEWLFYDSDGITIVQTYTTIEAMYQHDDPGNFEVGMVIENECATDTIFKNVTFTTSIEEYGINDISVYPNPSKNGIFQLKNLSNNIEQIKVMNALGQTIYTNRPNGTISQLDLSNQHPGIYFLTVTSENGEKLTKRLLITK